MSLEKTVVVAISALLGSCAAYKSRKSRLQAGESLEESLSTAHAVEPTRSSPGKGHGRSSTLSSWLLAVHALVSCCVVWVLTGTSQNDGWVVAWSSGLALVLVMHILAATVCRDSPEQNRETAGVESSSPLVDDDYIVVCHGRWMKDREASESMDPVCDLMGIGGIMRFALQFIVGSDVCFENVVSKENSGMCFSFAAFSVVKWFTIKESYPTCGDTARHRRRDLRSGGMYGYVKVTQETRFSPALNRQVKTPIVEITNEFGGYCPGTLHEVFRWPEDGLMVVDSIITNEHGSAKFAQIFRRKT